MLFLNDVGHALHSLMEKRVLTFENLIEPYCLVSIAAGEHPVITNPDRIIILRENNERQG